MPDKGASRLFALLGASSVFEDYQRRLEATVPRRLEAVHLAKALTRSVGVVSVEWVAADSVDVEADSVRATLQSEQWCRFLDHVWFWDPATPPGRNRLVNVTIKMLAACGPLAVSEIRGGLDRTYRFGRLPHVPSPSALRLFYVAHSRFSLDDEDVVRADQELDPMVELDDTERTLYVLLKSAPRGVLDRAELMRRGIAAGLNQNSLGVYSSYSPILDNPVQDCWVLRGSDVSPAVLQAAHQPRRVRFHDEAWLESGALRVVREIGQGWGIVVSLPQAYARLFAGRSFVATTQTGESTGQIRFNDRSNSWGYGPFLQDRNAIEGDTLVADFDLASATCVLSLRRRDRAQDETGGGSG